ncbi:DUF6325 family protein [Microlunatus ginsengisoli]|uniref:DUF1269 domain-containing protein n=1 Tax=Microlunatus ginsengisoli TaxID=363863 RepID=A0ABP7AV81_9ACTN
MTSFGPADLYVVAFPEDHIPAPVRESLLATLESGVITLLDLTVVRRTADGEIDILEVDVLGDEIDLTEIELSGSGLLGEEDLDLLTRELPAGSSALVVLLENTWARSIAGAVRDAGATVLAVDRFPAEVVNEVAELAGFEA